MCLDVVDWHLLSQTVAPCFLLSSGNHPSGESHGVWACGRDCHPARPPGFWSEEVGKGMWLRWWRCSWRTGMQRTTRVQSTAELTLHRLSATMTGAITLPDCQVRRGLPHRTPTPPSPPTLSNLYALMCRDWESLTRNICRWQRSCKRGCWNRLRWFCCDHHHHDICRGAPATILFNLWMLQWKKSGVVEIL